jgi:cell division transport system permease protein
MHLFFFTETWRSIRHHRGLVSTAVFSIAAALTLSGIFLLAAHNGRVAITLLGDRRELVVYLKDQVTPAQRDALMGRLQEHYGSVTYVSREDAWDEFTQQIGDRSLLEAVGGNPLPASFRVKLRAELLHFDAMERTASQVQEFPEVEAVRFGGEWVRRLDRIQFGLMRSALIVGILVAFAVLFVLYNTNRLTVMARRPTVEIMSRLGATDGFIAMPFVFEALFESLVASVLALGLVYAFAQALAAQIGHVAFLPWTWALGFVGTVVILGWISASLACGRVLRSIGP